MVVNIGRHLRLFFFLCAKYCHITLHSPTFIRDPSRFGSAPSDHSVCETQSRSALIQNLNALSFSLQESSAGDLKKVLALAKAFVQGVKTTQIRTIHPTDLFLSSNHIENLHIDYNPFRGYQ